MRENKLSREKNRQCRYLIINKKIAYKGKEYDIMEAEGICLINSKQIKNSECLLNERKDYM